LSIGSPPAWRAAVEAIVMIEPGSRSIIPGRKVFRVKNVTVRLPRRALFQSVSVIWVVGPASGPPPATNAPSTSAAPYALGFLAQPFQRVKIRGVGREPGFVTAVGADARHDLAHRGLAAAVDLHLRAVGRQHPAGGGAGAP
jgi:hypothetical protein